MDEKQNEDMDKSAETSGRRLVYFAAERTLLSWVRTSLTLMALGFVIDRFGLFMQKTLPGNQVDIGSRYFSYWVGAAFVFIGVLMNIVAAVRYWRFALRYRREGSTEPGPGLSLAIVAAVVIAVAGTVVGLFLLTVVD
jgi:putative membrane protein